MTLPRRFAAGLLLSVGLAGGTALAQSPNPGWIIPNPNNARYLEVAPPGGVPFAIASYGSLTPCDHPGSAIVSQAVGLKNAGSTYARLWYFWSCTADSLPQHEPWLRCSRATSPDCNENDDAPQWDLTRFDEQYWAALKSAVDAARNMKDNSQSPYETTPLGVRLAVEVPVFRVEDFYNKRGTKYNPFKDGSNINEVRLGSGANGFIKPPYLCRVVHGSKASDPSCVALGFQEAYVRQLIDVTYTYGNVIYEVMNEPENVACGGESPECFAALDYWPGYWADFVKDHLATKGVSRVISNSSANRGYEVADVAMANIHTANDDACTLKKEEGSGHEHCVESIDVRAILRPLSETVRTNYLTQPAKVTNVDEMGNGDWDPARLRKKSWTIVASGGHFHIEDPCDPSVRTCTNPYLEPPAPDPSLNARPWDTVLNVNRFLRSSGWQHYRARPEYREDDVAAEYFYWMVQGDPEFDTVGFANAHRIDHVGYLASRPAEACTTAPLLANLPAVPVGATEYVAQLWDPTGTGTDNYLRNAQGNRLEYRFTWAGGDFDWCSTPFRDVILSRAFPSEDLVFHVNATWGAPVVLSVTKLGNGTGTVVSTAPNTAINCGSACSSPYPVGTSVTLRATPGAGSTFGGWSGGGCGTQATCTTVLSSSQQVSATFTVPVNDARFLGQLVPTTTMVVGASYRVEFTVQNAGTLTWTPEGQYRLGSLDTVDGRPSVWTVGRVDVSEPVLPGQTVRFGPSVTPTTPGPHVLQWRMLQEGVEWFGQPTEAVTITVRTPSWRVVGSGDFNGDSKPDLVWQNESDGRLEVWLMDGATLVQRVVPQPDRPAADGGLWEVRAVADLNGDGNADILWQKRTDSTVVVWLMNRFAAGALTKISSNLVGQPQDGPGLWKIAAVADFNSDGHPDLLWQHQADGYLVVWLMDGVTHADTASPSPNRSANEYGLWKVKAAADFNQDGQPDLLWQREGEGYLVVWYMNGLTQIGATPTDPKRSANEYDLWTVAAAADFNRDGSPDLLWQREANEAVPSGARVIWWMNGVLKSGASGLSYAPPN